MLSVTPAITPAIMSRKRRRILHAFRQAGAIKRDSARSFNELGLHSSLLIRNMIRQQILVGVDSERYYLDEERNAAETRARLLRVGGIILLLFFLTYWYLRP